MWCNVHNSGPTQKTRSWRSIRKRVSEGVASSHKRSRRRRRLYLVLLDPTQTVRFQPYGINGRVFTGRLLTGCTFRFRSVFYDRFFPLNIKIIVDYRKKFYVFICSPRVIYGRLYFIFFTLLSNITVNKRKKWKLFVHWKLQDLEPISQMAFWVWITWIHLSMPSIFNNRQNSKKKEKT